MWLAKEIGCHGTSVGANVKLPITQSAENRIRATIPARPGERRVSIHILRIDGSARIQEHLDGVFGTERCGAVEGRFCLRSAITHEAARFNGWLGHTVGIRPMTEKHFDHEVMGEPVGSAQG